MEVTQHAKYTCTFCGKVTVRRKSTGVWNCRSCDRTIAGGAYTVAYVKPNPPRLVYSRKSDCDLERRTNPQLDTWHRNTTMKY